MSKLRLAFALIFGLLVISAASFGIKAFDLPEHRLVTTNALRRIKVTINGKERTFTQPALDQVIESNERTDSNWRLSMALLRPERHFTNEAFPPSMVNLKTLKGEILAALRQESPDVAELLGHQVWTGALRTGSATASCSPHTSLPATGQIPMPAEPPKARSRCSLMT